MKQAGLFLLSALLAAPAPSAAGPYETRAAAECPASNVILQRDCIEETADALRLLDGIALVYEEDGEALARTCREGGDKSSRDVARCVRTMLGEAIRIGDPAFHPYSDTALKARLDKVLADAKPGFGNPQGSLIGDTQ